MAKTIVSGFYQQAMTGLYYYLHQELGIRPGRDYWIIQAKNESRLLNVVVRIYPKHLRKLIKYEMTEELAMAMGLGAEQRLRISRSSGGTISLEIPKPESLCSTVSTRQLPHRAGVVGLDTRGRPTRLNFDDPLTPHVLLAGMTGSGKTNTQKVLAWRQMAHYGPEQVGVLVIDVEKQGRQWGEFDGCRHLVHPIITEQEEARQALAWVVSEMEERKKRRENGKLFVVVDEMQSLVEAGGCVRSLDRLARVGREFGIHLVVATQHPNKEAFESITFKRNLTARLVGRVNDANAAYVATGQPASGAETLSGKGDTILVAPGAMTRLTVALLEQRDFESLPRAEEAHRLPLGDLDPDRVLDVAPEPHSAQMPEPFTMAQLAYALVSRRGINHLQKMLGIGGNRAGRLKADADELDREIKQLGYQVVIEGDFEEVDG